MEKKKRRSLRNILAVAFTFAMVMVFAGLVEKVDAKAGTTTCSMTIFVKDAKGNLIENATPFVDIWEPVGLSSVYKINRTLDTCVKKDDGSYTFTIEWDSTPTGEYNDPKEGFFVATPGADAPGYKINRMAETDPYNVGFGVDGFQLKDGNEYGEDYNNSPYTVVLTAQTDEERLAEAKTTGKKKLNDYKKESDYGEEEWKQVQNIILEYEDSIDAIEISDELTVQEAEAKIAEYVTAAKAEMDQVVTAQSKINDAYVDYISFDPVKGKPSRDFAGSNGKYAITMSMQDKGGLFRVNCKENTNVTWKAGRYLSSSETGGGYETTQEYIGNIYDKGIFLSDRNAVIPYIVTTLKDCSVTFTPANGNDEVTVVFDLVVKESLFKELAVQAEKKVTLTRNDELKYNTVLEFGKDYSVVANYDSGAKVTEGIKIDSLDPEIATVDEKLRIKPLKAGTATFKATFEDEDGIHTEQFEIEFAMSQEEVNEDTAASNTDKLISAIGDVTLSREDAIKAARAAYDKLNANAKKKVTKLDELRAAESKITTLKNEMQDISDAAIAGVIDSFIANIGDVTSSSKESAIKAARAVYNNLSANAKKKVTKLSLLEFAEKKLVAVKAAEKTAAELAEKTAANEVAAKIAAAEKAAAKNAKAEAEKKQKEEIKKNTPSATKWDSAKSVKKNTVTLKWKKDSKASGYIIYMSTKKNSGYKMMATVQGGKNVTYTLKNLAGGKTCYFKIKSYKTVGNTTYTSAYSTVKKVKVKAK